MDIDYYLKLFVVIVNDEGSSNLDLFSLEMFENIAYIMAKHASPDIPDTPGGMA